MRGRENESERKEERMRVIERKRDITLANVFTHDRLDHPSLTDTITDSSPSLVVKRFLEHPIQIHRWEWNDDWNGLQKGQMLPREGRKMDVWIRILVVLIQRVLTGWRMKDSTLGMQEGILGKDLQGVQPDSWQHWLERGPDVDGHQLCGDDDDPWRILSQMSGLVATEELSPFLNQYNTTMKSNIFV